MSVRTLAWMLLGCSLLLTMFARAESSKRMPPERGKDALLGRHFTPPTFSSFAYDNAWKVWDTTSKTPPDHYEQAFGDRYGLWPAPYPNGRYPMGLREVETLFGKGLSTDCLICHGGSILGKSYVGLGNASLDIQAFLEEMASAQGGRLKLPFQMTNVRGTSEAGAMSVFLLSFREPDLKLRVQPLDLELHDDLCEDTPAWWLLKKKKTMYHNGGGDARSVRSLMQFMMSPLNPPSVFAKEEATFRDIQAYLLSLEAPKYPFAIDAERARAGQELFVQHCTRCHGTYGSDWSYPNKIVPLKEIGTDPNRARGISDKFGAYYNKSWFGQEHDGWLADDYAARGAVGYQAPPLDGIWATAPYFHNGSVPTLSGVLNSKARPGRFTRSYHTDERDYDRENVGWRIRVLQGQSEPAAPPTERRKIYDTSLPGRSNGGHTYGDAFTDAERRAVIEYLKTL